MQEFVQQRADQCDQGFTYSTVAHPFLLWTSLLESWGCGKVRIVSHSSSLSLYIMNASVGLATNAIMLQQGSHG